MFRSAARPFSCSLEMVPRRDSSMSGALRSAASAMTAFTSSVVVMVSKFVWCVASRSKSPRVARLTALARSSILTSGMSGDGRRGAAGVTGTSTGAAAPAGGWTTAAAGVGTAAAAGAAEGCTGPAGVGLGMSAGAGPAMADAGGEPGTAAAGGVAAPAMAVGSASAAGRVTFASRAARRTSLVRPKSGMGHFP